MQRIAVLLIIVLSSVSARANFFLDINSFYFTDSLSTTATYSSTRMFIDAALGFDIDKKGYYQMGWNYGMFTVTELATGSTAKVWKGSAIKAKLFDGDLFRKTYQLNDQLL